ncbi:prolipoprotein diacylglyceryl transferase [Actinomyces sp. ZJ308]|uniref:prolipoprotein diacylglyceryl transferase n=1 Tax=Actinomyces sp. ZJ308 TaxID=2708342 RepID=UPI001421BF80|nr:prolipoprotein diacylglyceryl transferase [Actinomyces sp. ZJ308]
MSTAPTGLPSPSSSVWHIGPIPVRAYALCILIGVFVAVWWSDRRYRSRGGQPEVTLDVAIVAVPAGIVGARIYHVLSSPEAYFGPDGDPALIPQVWLGGLGIWGGIAGGVLAGVLLLRHRGLRIAPLADAVAPALLVAQAIGRLGNWFNQELYGAPTTLPWGLQIDDAHLPPGSSYPPGTLFHPTFLYEALWNLAGAALLVWVGRRMLSRRGVTGGRLLWVYLMVYTAGRVWIEMLRIDEAETILGLRLNVWTSIVIFLVGAIGLAIASRRPLSDAIERSGEGPGNGGSEDESAEKDSSEDSSTAGTDARTTSSRPASGA